MVWWNKSSFDTFRPRREGCGHNGTIEKRRMRLRLWRAEDRPIGWCARRGLSTDSGKNLPIGSLFFRGF
jgi:hypothetical protein